jgi:hypothetical protein
VLGTLLLVLSVAGVATWIPTIESAAELPQGTIFVVAAAAGAWFWWRSLRKLRQSVDVYERGMVWRIGGKEHVIPWANLAGVSGVHVFRRGMKVGFCVHLKTTDGRKISFDNGLSDVEVLYLHLRNWRRSIPLVPASQLASEPQAAISPSLALAEKYRLAQGEQVTSPPYIGELYAGPLVPGTGDVNEKGDIDWWGWGRNIHFVRTSFNRLIFTNVLAYGPFLAMRPDQARPTLLPAAQAFAGHPHLAHAQAGPDRYNSRAQLEKLQLAQLAFPSGDRVTFWCEGEGLALLHAFCRGQA